MWRIGDARTILVVVFAALSLFMYFKYDQIKAQCLNTEKWHNGVAVTGCAVKYGVVRVEGRLGDYPYVQYNIYGIANEARFRNSYGRVEVYESYEDALLSARDWANREFSNAEAIFQQLGNPAQILVSIQDASHTTWHLAPNPAS